MGNTPRYVGFLDPPYNVTLTDDSGAALNLTGCTSNSFTLTMLNTTTNLAQQGVGVWTVTNASAGQASYQWTTSDLATAGVWWVYTTVKLPAEPSPRGFDPELITILPGTVGAGAAPPGVLPAPAAAPLFFNLRDYGALGDGANQTIAINNTLSAAGTAGGGIVYGQQGTYLYSSDLVVPSNVHLMGAGKGTIFKAAAGANANGFKVAGASHVTISDLQVNGNKANTAQPGVGTQYISLNGIYITGSDDVTVRDCWINNYYEGGILADSSTNLMLANNRISGGNDNGIFLRPSPGNVSCSQATIVGNIVSGGGYSGIQAVRCTYITISGNVSFSNGPTSAQGDGIGSEGSQYVTISNNVCYSNGIQGINIRHTSEGGANQQSSHVVVANNVCYNHTSTNGDAGGIAVSDTDDIIITGNDVYSNYNGINFSTGTSLGVTNALFQGNAVRSNSNGGILFRPGNSSTFLLVDNYVADNGGDNLYATTRIWVIGGTYARATGSHEGIHLDTGAGGSVVQGAAIFDNTDNGVLISGNIANCEIRGCTFDNVVGTNQGRALYEASGSGPTRLVNNRIRNQSSQDFFFSSASSVARQNDDVTNGYRDEASGTATITTSGTTVTVTHNLYTTPIRIEITPTTDTLGNRFWISAKGATTFTISTNAAPASNVIFDWRAWAYEA